MATRFRAGSSSTLAKRAFIFALASMLPLMFFPGASANTGTVHLTNAYGYHSVAYNTYVKWSGDLYGDGLNYGVGSDSHINFTNFSLGSRSNPSWTFGVASQNGNATISSIQSSFVRFSGSTQSSKTFVLTFYYLSLPSEVLVAQPTNVTITASSYYSSSATWTGASSPAVYENANANYLMVKTTYSNPLIQFESSSATNTTSSQSSSTQTTSTSHSGSSTGGTSGSTSTSSSSASSSTSSSGSSSSTESQAPSFSIALTPSSGTISAGETSNFTVNVVSDSGAQPVSLTVAGAPTGVITSIIGPASGLNYSSTVLLSTTSSVQQGTYSILVTGSAGGVQGTVAFVLHVVQHAYFLQVVDSPPEGGSTSMSPGRHEVSGTSPIVISESPSSGWVFQYWTVNGLYAGDNTTVSVQVASNTTVVANFISASDNQAEKSVFPVIMNVTGASDVPLVVDNVSEVPPVAFSWKQGSVHTISVREVIPLTNTSELSFVSWTGGVSSSNGTIRFVVGGPMNLSAVYVARFHTHIVFEDRKGMAFSPSQVMISGSSSDFALSSSGMIWLQSGTYYLVAAHWDGTDLAQAASFPQFIVDAGTTYVISLPVYNIGMTVQDIFGEPLAGVIATLTLPDGSTISNETSANGVVNFNQVPGEDLQLKTQYLGVSNQFTVNPSQSSSTSITIALSYPVYGLLAIAAATVAGGMILNRVRKARSSGRRQTPEDLPLPSPL